MITKAESEAALALVGVSQSSKLSQERSSEQATVGKDPRPVPSHEKITLKCHLRKRPPSSRTPPSEDRDSCARRVTPEAGIRKPIDKPLKVHFLPRVQIIPSPPIRQTERKNRRADLTCARRSGKIPDNSSYFGTRNKLGQKHGRGSIKYENGMNYVGDFVNDKRDGFGKCYYPNGCVYTGFWKDDKRHGLGKMLYLHGDLFEGEWMMDQRHGCGTYHWADGGADVCLFVFHKIVGEGVRWSPCRRRTWLLVDGEKEAAIISREAHLIASSLGLAGVPTQYAFDSGKSK